MVDPETLTSVEYATSGMDTELFPVTSSLVALAMAVLVTVPRRCPRPR